MKTLRMMKTEKLSKIFNIQYGNSIELVYCEKNSKGINFVSRTKKNNGISDKVSPILGLQPFCAGLLTVAVGGSVLETFLQSAPFYTGFHVMVLTPHFKMSIEDKLFYCQCIRSNQYKYSYGRQANSSLENLLVPTYDSIPKSIKNFSINSYGKTLLKQILIHDSNTGIQLGGGLERLDKIFDLYNGIPSSELNRFIKKETKNCIPYIRPSYRQETSIDAFVNKYSIQEKYIFPKETLYVSTDGQGSHTFAYVSSFEFIPNSNVSVLMPKREMGLKEKLFYALCITKNRYKFSYGRKPKGERLKSVLLPKYPNIDVNRISFESMLTEYLELVFKI